MVNSLYTCIWCLDGVFLNLLGFLESAIKLRTSTLEINLFNGKASPAGLSVS